MGIGFSTAVLLEGMWIVYVTEAKVHSIGLPELLIIALLFAGIGFLFGIIRE